MLLEFGGKSLEEWHEEYPSVMDDPDTAPDKEATYQDISQGAPKDARRTFLKEFLHDNFVVGFRGNSTKGDMILDEKNAWGDMSMP